MAHLNNTVGRGAALVPCCVNEPVLSGGLVLAAGRSSLHFTRRRAAMAWRPAPVPGVRQTVLRGQAGGDTWKGAGQSGTRDLCGLAWIERWHDGESRLHVRCPVIHAED